MALSEWVLPFVLVGVWPVAYIVGKRVRDAAHNVIPMNDPVSVVLLIVSILPMVLQEIDPSIVPWDAFGVWPLAMLTAWWTGYIIGYVSVGVDLVYVAVHQIVDRTQTVDYVVRYYNRDGQMCWQPQGFLSICKTMLFGVHNPLKLNAVNRTRHVEVHQFMHPRVSVDAIDLAGMNSEEYEVDGRWLRWTVERLEFTPSPHCTDAPYDWIANALGYEELFQEYSSMQVEHLEKTATMRTAAMKASGDLLSAMGMKSPSNEVLKQLDVDLEQMFGRQIENQRRATRRESEREDTERVRKRFGRKSRRDDADDE